MTNDPKIIAALQKAIPKLKASDQKFAADLCASFTKYNNLSVKQWLWVGKLIARANEPLKPVVETVQVGGFEGVVSLFKQAQTHLKFPKIILLCEGKPVYLALAGKLSKAPGSINVMGEGKYPDRPWYGRVSPTGEWAPSASVEGTFKDALYQLLVKLGKTPARVAKEYGKLTGNCCFCHKPLSDPRSTAAGFGPVCAGHYGLVTEWKLAVKKAGLTVKETDFGETVESVPDLPSIPLILTEYGQKVMQANSVVTTSATTEKCFLCETEEGDFLVKDGYTICASCAKLTE